MGVKCIGQVRIEPAGLAELIMALKDVASEEERNRIISVMEHFQLGKKVYVPLTGEGKIDQSENRCKVTLERSRKEPQPVGEVVEFRPAPTELSISSAMMNRLWLYDGRLYHLTRNDYSQEQVHLLILDLLDKEQNKFKDLEEKFKRK